MGLDLDPFATDITFGDTDPPVSDITPGAIFGTYGDNGTWGQSPSTANTAAGSWMGGALPQVISDATAALKAGIGLSLAKDNLAYQRQANQIGLQIARTNALTDQARAQAVLGAQTNANRIAQQYPFGVPFGKTRNDQMLLIAAAVAVAFLAMNKRAK